MKKFFNFLLSASLVVGLSACSQNNKASEAESAEPVPTDTAAAPAPTQAPADSAAAPAPAPEAPAAQPAAEPEKPKAEEPKADDDVAAASDALKKIYVGNNFRNEFLSSSLRALIKKAENATPEGEIGDAPDYDLWTISQDPSPVRSCNILSAEPAGNGKVKAKIQFKDRYGTHSQTIVMVKEGGKWKADDFITQYGSLRKTLK